MKSPFQLIVKRTGKAIGDFDMIRGGDKVAVGISGGKDSLALIMTLKELQRRAKEKYEIVPVYLSITDQPPRDALFQFFDTLGMELKWFPSNIFQSVDAMIRERQCFMNESRPLGATSSPWDITWMTSLRPTC